LTAFAALISGARKISSKLNVTITSWRYYLSNMKATTQHVSPRVERLRFILPMTVSVRRITHAFCTPGIVRRRTCRLFRFLPNRSTSPNSHL